MVKAVLQGAYGGAKAGLSGGVRGVGLFHTLVFGSKNLTDKERNLRVGAYILFMFLLLNGSRYHIVGALSWLFRTLVMPRAHWPEGTIWWQTASEQATGMNLMIAGAAFLVVFVGLGRFLWWSLAFILAAVLWVTTVGFLTNFPWVSIPGVFSFKNLPFAIGVLGMFILAGLLLTHLLRRWTLAYKQVANERKLIFMRTSLIIAGEAIIVFLLMMYYGSVDLLPDNFWFHVVAWGWQAPMGYFIGAGLNWLTENRQIAGQMGTREQRDGPTPVFVDSNSDGVPDNQEGHAHMHDGDDGQSHR